MLVRRKIAVIGGDKRSKYLAQLLVDDKNDVYVYGYDSVEDMSGVKYAAGLLQAVEECDYIVGPIPFAENISIFAPLYSGSIPLNELIECIDSCPGREKVIFGGAMNNTVLDLLKEKKCRVVDLLKREDLSVLNAIASAEGAVQTAMEKMYITIHGCKALVIGYGRIGKILSKILTGLGAKVTVTARKNSDIAWINASGLRHEYTENIKALLENKKFDVVFNTVPSLILDAEAILKMMKSNEDCLIIDLASIPGGVDFASAENMGANVYWVRSLPGKVAPLTSAEYIKTAMYNCIHELNL